MVTTRPVRLVVGLLTVTLWAAGCGAGGPADVSLAELVAEQEDHDGSRVRAEGVVRAYDDPLHYWIEDPDVNRVELFPHETVAPHVGARIRVEGTFTFRDDEGRRIEVEEIEVLEADPG